VPSSTSSRSRNLVADARAGRRAPARGAAGGRPSRNGAASGAGSAIAGFLRTVAPTVILFLVIRAFLIEAFRIPSGSMIPTLLVGDWLFVNKLVYGPHVPFTSVSLPGYAEPARGDVVVFESPYQRDEAERGADPQPTLVKRLMGVPGDTVHMRAGLLHVNGVAQRQGYAAAENPKGVPGSTPPDEQSEAFAWQTPYALAQSRFGAAPARPTHDDWGPLVVPPGRYLMLGDNRYCSKDSRYWGLVPRANLRGRPLFVYFSYRPGPDEGGPGTCDPDRSEKAVPFVTDVRWGRVGHVIR
jgi:signal peptidase I